MKNITGYPISERIIPELFFTAREKANVCFKGGYFQPIIALKKSPRVEGMKMVIAVFICGAVFFVVGMSGCH
ncbi:hypothetical protein BSQ33_00090 [Vibrio gazogenes]|uniref:Uncharacterized protein n=1 Tax=Vibrio gazogenes TaxID=687 RepID=A0A1Z2SAS1_VIBGA|nr:hypothetical protein BSQ33_00090 [Vibrio gazogenes]